MFQQLQTIYFYVLLNQNYQNVKTDIDEIIRRIQLNPGERGFMPMKHPKLSDSSIAIFINWRNDGLIE